MLCTPNTNFGMPFFRSVEPAARNLRPLAGHRLATPPLLSPSRSDAPSRPARMIGRTSPLLAGVAVLAVAGALSAGMGSSDHPSPANHAARSVSAAVGPNSAPAPGLDALLHPVAYVLPMKAPAAALPAAKTATHHVPSVHARPNATHGAAVVSHRESVNVKAIANDLRRLRACESGGNYHEASGNGYYGAYQFDLSTWHGLGLSGNPSNASHQLQDVAVMRLESRKGWGPWPVCSYVAGLR